jgi:hypothetical protein
MKTAKTDTAARYLHRAGRSVETYGDQDPIGVLLGELCGAANYLEGDVMEIAARLQAEVTRAKERGDL